jgi:hypothetical protein
LISSPVNIILTPGTGPALLVSNDVIESFPFPHFCRYFSYFKFKKILYADGFMIHSGRRVHIFLDIVDDFNHRGSG